MKKILFLILTVSILVLQSCSGNQSKQTPTNDTTHIGVTTNIQIQNLTGEVKHGLNKITISDTIQLLIYRGVESCTMVQIK